MAQGRIIDVGTPSAVGFYGKLPALGDFVTRRLGREFVAPWDDWLQVAMASSRADLGDAWLDSYLGSPLWRFVLSSGVVGERVWTGVLMPSMDRVRRCFPLTLTVALPSTTNPFAIGTAQQWFETAEDLLLSVLEEEQFVLDEFDARVAELQLPPLESQIAAGHARLRPDGAGLRLGLGASGDPGEAMLVLADGMARRCHGSYSLWWSTGSERVEPSLLACEGLPSATGFGAMLAGDWVNAGWIVADVGAPELPRCEHGA